MSTSEINNIQDNPDNQPQEEPVIETLNPEEENFSPDVDIEPKSTPRAQEEEPEPVEDILNLEKATSDPDNLSKATSKAFAELLFMGKRAESLQVTPLLNDPAPLSELKSVDEKFNQRPQISPVPGLSFETRLRVTSPRDPTINFEELTNRTDNLLKNVESALTRSHEVTLRVRKNTRDLVEKPANGINEINIAPENSTQNILADQYTSPLKQINPFSPTRRLYEEKIQTSALQVPRLSSPVYHSSTSYPNDVEVEHRLRSSQNLIASIDKSLNEISETAKPKTLSPVPSYGSLQTPFVSTGLITNGYAMTSSTSPSYSTPSYSTPHYSTPSYSTAGTGVGVNYKTIIGDPKLISEIEAIKRSRPQIQTENFASTAAGPRESSADISKRVCSNIDNMIDKYLSQNLSPKGYPTLNSRLNQQSEGLKKSSVSSIYNPYQSMHLRDSMTSGYQHTKSYSISMDKPVIEGSGYGYSSAIPNYPDIGGYSSKRSYSPIGERERKYNNLFASSTGYSTNYQTVSPSRYGQSQNTITSSPPHSTSGLNTTLHQKMGPSPHKYTQTSPKSTPPKSGPIIVEASSHLLIIDQHTEQSPQKTEENEAKLVEIVEIVKPELTKPEMKSGEKSIKTGPVYYDEQQDDIGEGVFAESRPADTQHHEKEKEEEILVVEEVGVDDNGGDVFIEQQEGEEQNGHHTEENETDRKFKGMTFRPITEEDEQQNQYEFSPDYKEKYQTEPEFEESYEDDVVNYGSKIEEMLNQQDSALFDFDEVQSEQLDEQPPRYSLLNPHNTPNVSRFETTRKTIRNIPKVIWMTSSSNINNKENQKEKILVEGKERVPILKYVFQKFQDKEIEFMPSGNVSF